MSEPQFAIPKAVYDTLGGVVTRFRSSIPENEDGTKKAPTALNPEEKEAIRSSFRDLCLDPDANSWGLDPSGNLHYGVEVQSEGSFAKLYKELVTSNAARAGELLDAWKNRFNDFLVWLKKPEEVPYFEPVFE